MAAIRASVSTGPTLPHLLGDWARPSGRPHTAPQRTESNGYEHLVGTNSFFRDRKGSTA